MAVVDDPNEPCDYDGYVDYICGRSPGVDGRTLVDGTAVETLPTIPANVRCMGDKVAFVRVPECSSQWLLLGPAAALPTGHKVTVQQFSTGTAKQVRVKEYIAERTVRHRRDSYSFATQGESTRWVLATIVENPR